MASGNEFLDALKDMILPRTIDRIKGEPDCVRIILSDGAHIEARRSKIRDCRTAADLNAYVAQVMS